VLRVVRVWLGRWVALAALCAAGLALAAPDGPVSAATLSAAALLRAELRDTPFAIVDKRAATLAVYGRDGQLRGAAPALLGVALGDRAFPDPRRKLLAGSLPEAERSTPAGRFDAVPGPNHQGERVVWIDYAAALAIHRLRPAPLRERRPERLASPDPADNRITFGCVVVAPAFFDQVVLATLGATRAVVLVLSEIEDGRVPLP
jgi:hypothetical protein